MEEPTDSSADQPVEDAADEVVPDEWSCATRNTFTPVGMAEGLTPVDEGFDVKTAPSAAAFADLQAADFDDPVTIHTADESSVEATFVFANAEGEIVEELVVATRAEDGLWVEAQDTVCA